jgi:hypothetical protein
MDEFMKYPQFLLVLLAIIYVGCGNHSLHDAPSEAPQASPETSLNQTVGFGPLSKEIMQASADEDIPPEILLIAAYVQSNLGVEAEAIAGHLQFAKREPVFGIHHDELEGINYIDKYEISRFLARKIKALVEKRNVARANEYLYFAAKAIIGERHVESEHEDILVNSLYGNFLDAYNQGFISFLPHDEIAKFSLQAKQMPNITTPAILINKEDKSLIVKRFESYENVKVLLRFCPSNIVVCYDEFKNNPNINTHYLVQRGDTKVDYIQLNPLAQDLSWYNKKLNKTVIITIAGTSGLTYEGYLPQWFKLENYYGLSSFLKEQVLGFILESFDMNYKEVFTSPDYQEQYLESMIEERVRGVYAPEGRYSFNKPLFWNSELFYTTFLTNGQKTKNYTHLRTSLDQHVVTLDSALLSLDIEVDINTDKIQIYRDNEIPTSKNAWVHIREIQIDPKERKINFSHEFRYKGVRRSDVRYLLIIATSKDGTITAEKIIGFRSKAIR